MTAPLAEKAGPPLSPAQGPSPTRNSESPNPGPGPTAETVTSPRCCRSEGSLCVLVTPQPTSVTVSSCCAFDCSRTGASVASGTGVSSSTSARSWLQSDVAPSSITSRPRAAFVRSSTAGRVRPEKTKRVDGAKSLDTLELPTGAPVEVHCTIALAVATQCRAVSTRRGASSVPLQAS